MARAGIERIVGPQHLRQRKNHLSSTIAGHWQSLFENKQVLLDKHVKKFLIFFGMLQHELRCRFLNGTRNRRSDKQKAEEAYTHCEECRDDETWNRETPDPRPEVRCGLVPLRQGINEFDSRGVVDS